MAAAATGTPTKRADARKNVEAIVEAATACLARDPDTSVNDIARAAGVGRVTLYGHFENRSALVAEVVSRAMAHSDATLSAVDLTGEPVAALSRLLDATWRITHRYGAVVVAAEQALTPAQLKEAHEAPVRRVQRVLRRGRQDGSFRTDMPLSWQVIAIQGILHAAVQAVQRGDLDVDHATGLVRDTALAVVTPAP